MKIIIVKTAVFIFLLHLTACQSRDEFQFTNSDISFQIYPIKDKFLVAINTSGEGVRKLSILAKDAIIIDEIVMENEPFEISSIKNDTIVVRFFVGDLRLFKPWFNNTNNKTEKIDKYHIQYTYIESRGGSTSKQVNFDSFLVSKPDYNISFYSKGKIVSNAFTGNLDVYKDKLELFEVESNNVVTFIPNNSQDIKKYINKFFLE